MAAKLIITRGIPGSGKSTWARSQNAVSISRDDLRNSLFGTYSGLTHLQEQQVTEKHQNAARALLQAGLTVIDDSTNLPDRNCREWRRLAHSVGAEFEIEDFRSVSLDTCLNRNASRERKVPEDVIRSMYSRQVKGKNLDQPLSEDEIVKIDDYVYVPDTLKPRAILLDIDGTIADMREIRGPFETDKYHLDEVHKPIRELVWSLSENFNVIALSGRDRKFADVTIEWLIRHHIPVDGLYMRSEGDKRNDAIVKKEIFRSKIAPHFNVVAALDDRDRVVKMYRSIGLTCLQVREGNF